MSLLGGGDHNGPGLTGESLDRVALELTVCRREHRHDHRGEGSAPPSPVGPVSPSVMAPRSEAAEPPPGDEGRPGPRWHRRAERPHQHRRSGVGLARTRNGSQTTAAGSEQTHSSSPAAREGSTAGVPVPVVTGRPSVGPGLFGGDPGPVSPVEGPLTGHTNTIVRPPSATTGAPITIRGTELLPVKANGDSCEAVDLDPPRRPGDRRVHHGRPADVGAGGRLSRHRGRLGGSTGWAPRGGSDGCRRRGRRRRRAGAQVGRRRVGGPGPRSSARRSCWSSSVVVVGASVIGAVELVGDSVVDGTVLLVGVSVVEVGRWSSSTPRSWSSSECSRSDTWSASRTWSGGRRGRRRVTLHGVTTASKAAKAIAPEPPSDELVGVHGPRQLPLPLVAPGPTEQSRSAQGVAPSDEHLERTRSSRVVYRAWRSAAPVSLGGFQSLGTPATLITRVARPTVRRRGGT